MKTVDFLDAIKQRHALPSDYATAKLLHISPQQVSMYRAGTRALGDETALRVAELLDLPAGYVLACVHAERTSDSAMRRVWDSMADTLKAAKVGALGVTVGMLLSAGHDPASARLAQKGGLGCNQTLRNMSEITATYSRKPALNMGEGSTVYYVNSLVRSLVRRLRAAFSRSAAPAIMPA